MTLFESTLALLVIAVVLLQVSRRFSVPYPTMLALSGACIAALPLAPRIVIEPRLALALFIAPVLLDAAFDLPPRELHRNWVPLVGLALTAVVFTAAVVAWVGIKFAGLPLAAAFTVGAIVAPPDAAAATAVLNQFKLPRRTMSILKGESLLNDAAALLIFAVATSFAMSSSTSPTRIVPQLILAVPGGILLGLVLGKLFLLLRPFTAGTLTDTIVQFVFTFGVWLVAEHFRVSPILAVVAFAMFLAHYVPALTTARERVHSYSVWEAAVFLLNVLAFLMMGLQARVVLSQLSGAELWSAIRFSLLVLAVVVFSRLIWIMPNVWISRRPYWIRVRKRFNYEVPLLSYSEGILMSWCGMRGLVTIATALAHPPNFPRRDLIVLSAFAVVLGTLVIQGLTIRPLLLLLHLPSDSSVDREVSFARAEIMRAAISEIQNMPGDAANAVRAEYAAAESVAENYPNPQGETEYDRLRMSAIAAQRRVLWGLRRQGRISDDAFHRLEEELDWSELSAAPRGYFELLET
jgi:Na+/H+ antiporter